MKFERLITVFDSETEGLKEEINIDYIGLDQLKKIFKAQDDDPLMYNIYEIKADHVQSVNELLKNKIAFDLRANAYYIECAQLPPYDFGKKEK